MYWTQVCREIGQGTWSRPGSTSLDIFVTIRKSWCGDKPQPRYSPPAPPEESLEAGFAGWNGIDESGRRWEHGRYVEERWPPVKTYLATPKPRLKERYDSTLLDRWKQTPDRAYALLSRSLSV